MQPATPTFKYLIENNISPEEGFQIWLDSRTYELTSDSEPLMNLFSKFYSSTKDSDEYFKDWLPQIKDWIFSGDPILVEKAYFVYCTSQDSYFKLNNGFEDKSFFQA